MKSISYLLVFVFSQVAVDNEIQTQLDHLNQIRTSDIEAFKSGVSDMLPLVSDMTDSEYCQFQYLNGVEFFYQSQYQKALEHNIGVLKECASQAFGSLAAIQNAMIHSAQGSYTKAFENMHLAQEIKKASQMRLVTEKQFLSAAILTYTNLAQFDLAKSHIQELSLLDQSPMYRCRVLFNQLNIALLENDFSLGSRAYLDEVKASCGEANESLYQIFSEVIWHLFGLLHESPSDDELKEKITEILSLESAVESSSYPYVTMAFQTILAHGYAKLKDFEQSKKYATQALQDTLLGDAYFRLMAQNALIAYHIHQGDFEAAFYIQDEKFKIEQDRHHELESMQMASELVAQAVAAKERSIQLLAQQNDTLSNNEALLAKQDRLKTYLAATLALLFVLSLVVLWRLMIKFKNSQKAAETDLLTQVSNRRGLQLHIENIFTNHDVVHSEVQFAVMDLDDFNVLNNSKGHDAGDQVIVQVAQRVEALLPENGFLSRVGGDAFCLVLSQATSQEMKDLLDQIRLNIQTQTIEYQGQVLNLTASFGFTSASPGHESFERLWRKADKAMFQAKKEGKNTVRYVVNGG